LDAAGQGGGKGISIWESPSAVAKHGLFGVGGMASPADSISGSSSSSSHGEDNKHAKKAAEGEEKDEVETKGEKGPLPSAKTDAAVVERGDVAKKDAEQAKARGKRMKPWQEKGIQTGAMRRESTEVNLDQAVEHHDESLLKKMTGISGSTLKTMEDDAESLAKKIDSPIIGTAKKGAAAAKGKKPDVVAKWQEAEMQKGAMRRESVADNLKDALTKRELHLLVKKSGWKSEADLKKAEKFAENLEAAVSTRRAEEAKHPLMPKMAKKTLEDSDGALSQAKVSKHQAAAGVGGATNKAGAASAGAGAESGGVGVDGAKQVKEEKEEMKDQVRVQMRKEELQRLQEESPVVAAYEGAVRNDEGEYREEVRQERSTLARLNRDQAKLAKEISSVVDEKSHSDSDSDPKVADGKNGGGAGGGSISGDGSSASGEVPPAHGYSAKAAAADLNGFFVKEDAQEEEKSPK